MNSIFSLLFLFFTYSNAFNITNLLAQYSAFSTFNNYLTQTQLASVINSRQTITLLVVDNDNISPVSDKPLDVIKKILSVHVMLDYYDVIKLQSLPNKTSIITTLFQSSGSAIGQQGFLNVTDLSTGSVVIGSADKGATLSANLVKSIAAQPYNISVLQISTVIIPMGIDNSKSKSPSPAPAKSLPPIAPPPSTRTPAPSNASDPGEADTPSAAPGSPPRPDIAPTADAPAADGPTADNSPNNVGTAIGLGRGLLGGVFTTILQTLYLTVMI